MAKRRLGVIGAGGHGKVVADTAERCGWEEVVFFDALAADGAYSVGGWSVVGAPDAFETVNCDAYFVAVGSAAIRKQWAEKLIAANRPLATLIDPSAVVSRYARLADGVLIVAGAVVNADTTIGRCAIVNTRAALDHDCELSAFSHVCPGATLGGMVLVGESSWLGIGCQVRQGIVIGSKVTVGAGATVVADIADGLTVIGTPARPR